MTDEVNSSVENIEANVDQNEQKKKAEENKVFDELIKKRDAKRREELIGLLSTREILERDYNEDVITVTFATSPNTKRSVLAHRPTHLEMMTMLKLSSEALLYEGKTDPESLKKMIDIYETLPKIADKMCVDESLDEKFWRENVSFTTLLNFVTELISETQKATNPIKEADMDKFR